MPIIVAGLVYAVLAVPALAGCLIWGAVPRKDLIAGGVGSVIAFVMGCAAAMAVMLFGSGVEVSATLVVTAAGLTGATAGAFLGVLVQRRLLSRA